MGKQIRSRVKQARLEYAARMGRTISIREVSRETGIAVSTLRRLENNEAQGIEFATLSKMAEFYGAAKLDDLFQFEDERRTLRHARLSRPGRDGGLINPWNQGRFGKPKALHYIASKRVKMIYFSAGEPLA